MDSMMSIPAPNGVVDYYDDERGLGLRYSWLNEEYVSPVEEATPSLQRPSSRTATLGIDLTLPTDATDP
jgi:hypothetical protein